MDTKFQTSFIPKKSSIVEQKTIIKHAHSTSLFVFFSTLIFIVSVAGAVYSILGKNVLLKTQESYKTALEKAEKSFDASLIEDLRRADAKLDLGEQLLKNHMAVSDVFEIIGSLTIEGVKFDNFEFTSATTENGGVISMVLDGIGNSFSSIAFQSDVFGQSAKFGTNKVLKNPIVRDLVLKEDGSVAFTFTADLSPADILYYSKFEEQEENKQ